MFRFLGTLLGLIALSCSALGFVARFVPVSNHLTLVAAALSPYLMAGGPIALFASIATRRWLMTVGAAILTVAMIVSLMPLFIADRVPVSAGINLRLLTANIYLGEADPKHVVALAVEHADVISVQELTEDAVKNLTAAGIDAIFPYRVVEPRPGASGTGLWSRFPITESQSLPGHEHAIVVARIKVPGLSGEQTVFAAHLPGPYPGAVGPWSREHAELADILRDTATSTPGCVIVAGDFNSTFDMTPFRKLLQTGYRDAAEQTGAGITPTYPADHAHVPALIEIDHVLTHGCDATSFDVVTLPGSDHRGLVVDVKIPTTS